MTELRQLRQLTEENARLKRVVADLTLDNQILQEVIKKRSETGAPPRDRPLDLKALPGEHGWSEPLRLDHRESDQAACGTSWASNSLGDR